MRGKKYLFFLITLFLLFLGCGSTLHETSDPNVVVCVSSQYDDGPEILHNCGPKFHETCKNKTAVDCVASLYHDALTIIKYSNELTRRNNHHGAYTGYQKAHDLLRYAHRIFEEARVVDSDDWNVANMFGLGKKIKKELTKCQELLRIYRIK